MTTLSKAEYLQRYLSTGKDEEKKIKKKKKNKEKAHVTGLRIVEDDAFLAVSAKFKDVDSDEEREDIAIISSISRQVEEKAREAPKFRSSFKPLDEKEEDVKPTVSTASTGKSGTCFKKLSSSFSREAFPPPGHTEDGLNGSACPLKNARRHDSDSDSDQSPPRKGSSQPQRSRKRHDSDQSPARRRHDSDQSPVRRRYDSSESPPRHSAFFALLLRLCGFTMLLFVENTQRRRHDSDSDHSPPRRKEKSRNQASIKVEVDSDQSPPRKERSGNQTAIKVEVDLDQSPLRRDESPPRKREPTRGRERRIASPEKLGKEVQQTLDGKIAGLQSADDLKKESEKIRQREAKMFEEMDASISGRFAETTVREKQVRKRREKPEDKERKEREAKKQAELQEKYNLWNKGVAQTERREQQLEEMARVAAEPLARMADDEEMNRHLKDIIHEEDPMAAMLMSKKREKAIDRGELIYPTYQGECPPNRFGIRPGYRWDGVDRSNGFEAKLALAKNKKDAQEKEYYQNLQLYE
ncbi:hypothetical protein ANCCAN_24067 [Ancylostoma caninum]|uniref:BUD13 homolog n=1 Tax=Ancylostoma caninum TaxID=29170 RepID=A0A368FDA2_ANCCA|nr:hypothetical protein ANCCAN_24067 [Ancylostoma caninum]